MLLVYISLEEAVDEIREDMESFLKQLLLLLTPEGSLRFVIDPMSADLVITTDQKGYKLEGEHPARTYLVLDSDFDDESIVEKKQHEPCCVFHMYFSQMLGENMARAALAQSLACTLSRTGKLTEFLPMLYRTVQEAMQGEILEMAEWLSRFQR
jgi:hypothetical protein